MSPQREVLAEALAQAVEQLASEDLASTRGRREAQLRAAVVEALLPCVAEGRTLSEWRPQMPYWPKRGNSRLGGFDLAVRFQSDVSYSTVAELKWSRHGLLDALDEVPWDLCKLAHARATLLRVTTCLLLYVAPVAAWQKPARFVEIFDGTRVDTRRLIERHPNVWRWLLKNSAKSRPTALPPEIKTESLTRVPFGVSGETLELRAATVEPRGRLWVELDDEGWPTPASVSVALTLDGIVRRAAEGDAEADAERERLWRKYTYDDDNPLQPYEGEPGRRPASLVAQDDSLSTDERREKLQAMLDSGEATEEEVLGYGEMLIMIEQANLSRSAGEGG